jgi:hypothetical protein
MSTIAHAASVIEAPIELVRSIMCDPGHDGEWNPCLTDLKLRGDAPLASGAGVCLYSRWMDTPNGAHRKTLGIVTRIIEPAVTAQTGEPRHTRLEYRFAEWMARARFGLATREQTLREIAPGRTEYVTHEQFHSLLNRFVPMKRVQAGFETHAITLKRCAESPCAVQRTQST